MMIADACLIAKRDYRSYFVTPVAYVVIAVFLALVGSNFFEGLERLLQASQSFLMVQQGPRPAISEYMVGPIFGYISVILLFVVPFVTMRLFADEKREHTEALLFSAPISLAAIVLGKFLAAMAFLSTMLAATIPYMVLLIATSNVDIGVILTCYLGTFLGAAAYVAIGLFWSATTENQIIAAMTTFGSLLTLWLLLFTAQQAGPVWSEILRYLAILEHFQRFASGMIDTSDLIYYLSVVLLGLFGTWLVIDAKQRG